MIYLEHFSFPSKDDEFNFFNSIQRQCYTNFYPFQVLTDHERLNLDFENVTILYGSNGSGKSTALNAIAEKLDLKRDANYNKSNFYDDYLSQCSYRLEYSLPEDGRIITSDDVFEYALSVRDLNDGIDQKRDVIFEEYLDAKYANFQMKSLEDYNRLKQINDSRRMTQSRYTREHLINNIRTHSNGENAFKFFTQKIGEGGLYLLDEPENSLAPKLQLELKKFIEESARYFNCQIIMVTHSPFLLSIEGAKIYNFDKKPVTVESWTNLDNVKTYFEFFNSKGHEFKK